MASRKLARRGSVRRRRRGRRNPGDTAVGSALAWLGGGAIVGAGFGVLTSSSKPTGALVGAEGALAVVGVAGLVVGAFSKKHRQAGFYTAGIGLGSLALLGLVTTLIPPMGTMTTTTTTTA